MEFFLAAWAGYLAATYLRASWAALCIALFVIALDTVILRDIDFFPADVVLALWSVMVAKALTGALLAHATKRAAWGWRARRAATAALQAPAPLPATPPQEAEQSQKSQGFIKEI